jgi:hypothetical protein
MTRAFVTTASTSSSRPSPEPDPLPSPEPLPEPTPEPPPTNPIPDPPVELASTIAAPGGVIAPPRPAASIWTI